MNGQTNEHASPDFAGDEHWGKGGQYVVVDGKRVPASAIPPEPAAEPAPAAEPTPKKGK